MKPTVHLLLGLFGLRKPRTSVTSGELALLVAAARSARLVVEVGVSEGATSAALLSAMPPEGMLFLVDPYFDKLRLETWLGFSGTEWIARRTVRRFGNRAKFVRATSLEAATAWPEGSKADLIFLDAQHDYISVASDLAAWSDRLADDGVFAVHDCIPCPSRPELAFGAGGCRAISEALQTGWVRVDSVESLALIRKA
jgi:predicted O-methyltransferase YrrM